MQAFIVPVVSVRRSSQGARQKTVGTPVCNFGGQNFLNEFTRTAWQTRRVSLLSVDRFSSTHQPITTDLLKTHHLHSSGNIDISSPSAASLPSEKTNQDQMPSTNMESPSESDKREPRTVAQTLARLWSGLVPTDDVQGEPTARPQAGTSEQCSEKDMEPKHSMLATGLTGLLVALTTMKN